MKWPELVPDKYCKTEVRVVIFSENLTEDGAPQIVFDKVLKCNYQDKAKQVLNIQKQLITLTGTALFNNDIVPELPIIASGYVEVFGVKRTIYEGTKCRNPDGSVNYTRIDLQ